MQRALDAAGIDVRIVNARHVKRVPGRKTDISDSQWLAALARYGPVTPSLAAPPELEELRRLTRLHARTRQVASKARNMLHRLLDESGLRSGGILTDLFGVSGRALLAGLVEGLEEERILEAAERDWEVPWTLLQTLPGPLAAAALLAETGADMGHCGTARRLASWAGMCPGNRESADTARRNLARWMRMIEKAKLMPEVAQAAAESLRRSLEAARSATPAGGLPGAAAAATA